MATWEMVSKGLKIEKISFKAHVKLLACTVCFYLQMALL